MTFQEFKKGVGARWAQGLLRIEISNLTTWEEFQHAGLANRKAFGGSDDGCENFVSSIEKIFGTASTGERLLILGILNAIDYRALAERLCIESERSFFSYAEYTSGDYRDAALACIRQKNF